MKKVLVIVGPTAIGKTDLGIYFAKKINGEIISCDSRQVYKGLDIGTGKLPNKNSNFIKGDGWWEIDGVKIWIYDVTDINTRLSVYDYIKNAHVVLNDILDRKKLPIIVGGTGLYLKALIYGLPNLSVAINEELRKKLDKLPLDKLQERLKNLSISLWSSLNNSDKNNKRRLIRKIELMDTKPDISNFNKSKIAELNILKIGLIAPRQVLNKRIDSRVKLRLAQGMVDEVENLLQSGIKYERLRELGLEYSIIADYIMAETKNYDMLVKTLNAKIHQYAKRQLTWFKKEEGTNWFDISKKKWQKNLEKLVLDWYNN